MPKKGGRPSGKANQKGHRAGRPTKQQVKAKLVKAKEDEAKQTRRFSKTSPSTDSPAVVSLQHVVSLDELRNENSENVPPRTWQAKEKWSAVTIPDEETSHIAMAPVPEDEWISSLPLPYFQLENEYDWNAPGPSSRVPYHILQQLRDPSPPPTCAETVSHQEDIPAVPSGISEYTLKSTPLATLLQGLIDAPFDQAVPDTTAEPASEEPEPAPEVENMPCIQAELLKVRKSLLRKTPSSYQHGSFWVHPKEPVFALEDKITPQALYVPSIFVWAPHSIPNVDVKCRICGGKMTSHGLAPKDRAVVDLDRLYFIVSYRYHCTSCNATGTGYLPEILDELPPRVTVSFNAVLTKKSGISLRVLQLMRSCFHGGMSVRAFAAMLREFHLRRYEQLELAYLDKLTTVLQEKQRTVLPFEPAPFSSFDDQKGYAGFVPSVSYLCSVFVNYMESIKPALDQHTSLLSTQILSGDHSHKVKKDSLKNEKIKR